MKQNFAAIILGGTGVSGTISSDCEGNDRAALHLVRLK